MKQSLKAMCVAVLACSVFSVSADAARLKEVLWKPQN